MDPNATLKTSGIVEENTSDAPTAASNFQAASEPVADTDTDTTGTDDVSTAVHALVSNAWTPAGDTFDQFSSQMPVWQCMSGGVSTRSMYTMAIGQQYTFDLSEFSTDPSNGTTIFELSGVIFVQGSRTVTPSILSQPSVLQLGGQAVQPSKWQTGDGGACASVLFNTTLDISKGTDATFILEHLTVESDQAKRVLLVTDAHIVVKWAVAASATSLAPNGSAESAQSTGAPASSGGPKASTVVPAVLVPLVVLAIAGVLFFVMRRRKARRARLAPSAAFRADHAETIARGVSGTGRASPVPSNANGWVPLDEKQSFSPYK